MDRESPVHLQHAVVTQRLSGRLAQVDERQKRIGSLWGQMATVLKQIMKQRDAAHFSQPVDTEKLKVGEPPYYTPLISNCWSGLVIQGSTPSVQTRDDLRFYSRFATRVFHFLCKDAGDVRTLTT